MYEIDDVIDELEENIDSIQSAILNIEDIRTSYSYVGTIGEWKEFLIENMGKFIIELEGKKEEIMSIMSRKGES